MTLKFVDGATSSEVAAVSATSEFVTTSFVLVVSTALALLYWLKGLQPEQFDHQPSLDWFVKSAVAVVTSSLESA